MGELIPFPGPPVTVQIGDLSLRAGTDLGVHVREDDGRLIVDAVIFEPDCDIPVVVTMSLAEAWHIGGLLIEAAGPPPAKAAGPPAP